MKRLLLSLVAVGALLAAGKPSSAAERALIVADIGQEFSIARNVLPAGQYEFAEDDPNSGTLFVRNVATGKKIVVRYDSRLGARPDGQPVIVFDKEGDKEYLSEIHLGGQDGYYFSGAAGRHTHVTVKAQKKS